MTATSIEWATHVWNPVTGCTKVSAGCKNCYAEKVADRFWGDRKFTDVQTHEDRLDAPLHWRKPRRVFVNSMSDLFHDDVPDGFLDRVFAVMALASRHTFLVLTKRPRRMRDYLCNRHVEERTSRASVFFVPNAQLSSKGIEPDLQQEAMAGWAKWPRPNIWLGVSCENQETANKRVPLLLETPAAVRFLSCEPLLGQIFLAGDEYSWLTCTNKLLQESGECCEQHAAHGEHWHGIDWVIAGGESGPGARPCDVAWIRSLVGQCRGAGVAPFVKQLGSNPRGLCSDCTCVGLERLSCRQTRLSDRKGGDMAEWPDGLRVRELPR